MVERYGTLCNEFMFLVRIGDLNAAIDEIVQHPEASVSQPLGQAETAPPPRAQEPQQSSFGISASSAQSAPKPPSAPTVDPNKYHLSADQQRKMEELRGMGFANEIACEEALRKAKGNINAAVDILVVMQEENEKSMRHRPPQQQQQAPAQPPRSQQQSRAPAGSWDTNAYTGGAVAQQVHSHRTELRGFGDDYTSKPISSPNAAVSRMSGGDDLLKQREREARTRKEEEDKKNSQKAAILSLYESSPPPMQNHPAISSPQGMGQPGVGGDSYSQNNSNSPFGNSPQAYNSFQQTGIQPSYGYGGNMYGSGPSGNQSNPFLQSTNQPVMQPQQFQQPNPFQQQPAQYGQSQQQQYNPYQQQSQQGGYPQQGW